MSVMAVACRQQARSGEPQMPAGVVTVPDLCAHPDPLRDFAGSADELVLLVHPEDLELAPLQAAIRKCGFDPFGVPLIDISGAVGDSARLAVMIAGAVARAGAFAGSRPEHARPVMAGTMSRRSLLTIPRPHYVAVPAVALDLCAAGDGCRACVGVCPEGAYRWSGGRIELDKGACVSCGQCVTGCPTGAITNPSVSGTALLAEVSALVATSPEAVGVIFTCAQSKVPVTDPGWFQVEVPCTGMVPGTWPVASLLLGAGAATIRPCADGGCPLARDDSATSAASFSRSLVEAAGFAADLVPGRPGSVPPPLFEVPGLVDPFGVHGPAEVALALAAAGEPFAVAGVASPLGVVEIDPSSCTLCTMCSQSCPTGALAHEYADGRLALSFDASECTGCGQCMPQCPESSRGAITLHRKAETADLSFGRRVVNEAQTVACESCGEPVAPAAMLDRIQSLLGDEHAAATAYMKRRCLNCRGTF
jgi:ferredoxin